MSADDTEVSNRPIGYWVKALDRLLDDSLDRSLADDALQRRHWQVLNIVAEGTTLAGLETELAPFLKDHPGEVRKVVDQLLRRGAIAETGNNLILTAKGRELFDYVRTKVAERRQAMSSGVTREEYETAVSVLQKMVRNLETETPLA